MSPNVAGVDLSLTATAIARPDGRVVTHGRTGLTNVRTPLYERFDGLLRLRRELVDLVYDPVPQLLVVEDFPPLRTGLDPERCWLWWQVVGEVSLYGVPVLAVPPSVVKTYACGLGNANKREVVAAVAERFPTFEIRRTSKTGRVLTTYDDNKADAVVLMAIGCALLEEPIVELPTRCTRALASLELPPAPVLSSRFVPGGAS